MHPKQKPTALMYTTLIETAELAAVTSDPRCAILDCRFDLAQPEWGAREYAAGHIPHALYADLDRDLAGAVHAGSGRHPLPNPAEWAQTLSRWGIDGSVQVVAYDQGNGAYAARLWALVRWVGHTNVAVLNGGYAAWVAAGLPISTAVEVRPAAHFTPLASALLTLDAEEIERSLAQEEILLVDARAADRFAGENEKIDPVAGHIPGAVNEPFAANLGADGRFLPAPVLRSRWQAVLGTRRSSALVSMCGSGVTACHNLLALEIAGLPGARLYPGSWSEWIRDPHHPIARGLN
jgi:thiosulfate/3-mercaptopyruvate sulfurtransferase